MIINMLQVKAENMQRQMGTVIWVMETLKGNTRNQKHW